MYQMFIYNTMYHNVSYDVIFNSKHTSTLRMQMERKEDKSKRM